MSKAAKAARGVEAFETVERSSDDGCDLVECAEDAHLL